VEPYLRLYLARIFNRMNQKDKAIAAYLDFANRFPRRRQAVESVWKSAWLYEELNKPQQAMDLYRQIIRLWPASSYAREAQFREGFTLYRARQYERAAKAFAAIRLRNASDSHAHRAAYWLALCREAQGDSVSAAYLRRELARDLWDDYYTMKSYLMLNSHPDSAAHLARQFRGAPDPLRVVQPGYAPLVRQMAEAFQVGELLGNEFSLIALSDVRLNARSLGDWVALAEMYKKLRAYGLAYRTYDHIDRKFFRSLAYSQKPFIVKERFPFYYDNYIEQFGQRYGVEKEFILALMKQESVYQTDAHSSADAHGLMQLIPATAREMAAIAGVSLTDMRRLYEAELNIQLGALYIRQLQRHLGDRKDFILAAYNAGPHRVERWREVAGSDEMDVFIENIQFMETRDYVRKVMKNYWAYTLLSRNFAVTDSALFQTGRAQ
jgi:soluble lytic murein transglycosylase-like protein